MAGKIVRQGEYEAKGDYHRKLDKGWKYYPIYKAKTDFLNKFMRNFPKESKIIDIGCGEGVLVERYKKRGYNIVGLDKNYSSKNVIKGDITKKTEFRDNEFDLILCLDVIEHLSFDQQPKALDEMNRILAYNGILFLAIPNLSHFLSRISFLLTGRLIRTSEIERHWGDRPISEFLGLIEEAGFKIKKRKGIFPTFPISSGLTYLFPDKVLPLHRILNLFLAYPNWCFLNIIICKK